MTARRRAGAAERGSALMLVPAMIVVLIILGAIAVDFAIAFLAQRELSNRAAAAANDIAGFAVSDERFYHEGRITLSEREADAYVDLVFDTVRVGDRLRVVHTEADVGERTITVLADAEVRYLFSSGLPGARKTTVVHAKSTAEVVETDEK